MLKNKKVDLLKSAKDQIQNEDFIIGVGAPTGLNQGIPTSGDAIGVMPVLVGDKPQKRKIRKNKEKLINTEIPIIKDSVCVIKLPKLEKTFIEYIKEKNEST